MFRALRSSICLAGIVIAFASRASADYGDLPDDDARAQASKVEDTPVEPTARPTPSPIDWELTATAGYLSAPIRGGTTPFGTGFGARAGLNVSRFYFGFDVMYFLGGTDVTLSDHAMLYGPEIGYGAPLADLQFLRSKLVLRPMASVGDVTVSHTDPSISQNAKPDVTTTASGRTTTSGRPSDTTSINNIYLRPSLALLLVGKWHVIGVEGSMLVVPAIGYGGADPTTWISYGVRVQVGVHF